ncbi:hypothetical protein NIES806_33460 [Dolichospermum compactum NIES-806]|uniref:GIY-YIG domain-containing protein n=2 Tax=Dolichospermum compactum TaxID=136073 RepID=A0A1Z4V6R5_9CYAN|nr:hypothetical protein NIES806_33460 [Dolichospermum compactum NIES-806]
MRHTGLIKFFGKNRNNKKMNFGFITRDNGNEVYINKDNTGYTLAELAERLGLEESVIEAEKLNPNLSIWSSSKDPNSIQWEYLSETNNFYPIDLPEGMRVTFEVITNTEKRKDEAKSLRILLKQKNIIIENSNLEQNPIINTDKDSVSETINNNELSSLDDYDFLSSISYTHRSYRKPKPSINFGEYFEQLKQTKRINSVDFIYCLYLEEIDGIYWGMTSNLTQRMRQHYEGEVKSTCYEAKAGRIWILYTLPFKNREDAEKVEEQAWSKSGGGVLLNHHDSPYAKQKSLSVATAGIVSTINDAYRHLINLGWTGTKIKLKDFLSDTPKYLQLWDQIGNNINYDVLAEVFDQDKIREKRDQLRNRVDREKSEPPKTIIPVKKLRKNEVSYLVVYYAELNTNSTEVIKTIITTPAIITDYKNRNQFNKTILYLEAYQTREDAEKVLQNINTLTKFPNIGLKTNKIFTKSIGFQVFGSSIENIDSQITKVYLYLLDNGWNGRRFKIGLFLSAQSEVNDIQDNFYNYAHNERLKMLRKYILANSKDQLCCDLVKISKILSTSTNISWRTLLFPQEWLDIYEDYELQNQRVNSSDSKYRRGRLEEQERINALKAFFMGNSNTSNTSDQAVVKSDEPDDIDWMNV